MIKAGHALGRADHACNGLAAKASAAFGKDRLINEAGDDAEAVETRHVIGSEDPFNAGCGEQGVAIAYGETCMGMRGADDMQNECVWRGDIVAKGFAAIHLALPVQAADGASDRAALKRAVAAGFHDRIDDAPIAGAAAQNAAKRIHHLILAWVRHVAQERRGTDHHARRANAALGRVMVLEAFCEGLGVAVGLDQA